MSDETSDHPAHHHVFVIYNGVEKSVRYNPEEKVRVLLDHAIHEFGIVQNPHLLSLFTTSGMELNDGQSVESAGVRDGEKLLLRPGAVKGGAAE